MGLESKCVILACAFLALQYLLAPILFIARLIHVVRVVHEKLDAGHCVIRRQAPWAKFGIQVMSKCTKELVGQLLLCLDLGNGSFVLNIVPK
jgi:hypothetical protein